MSKNIKFIRIFVIIVAVVLVGGIILLFHNLPQNNPIENQNSVENKTFEDNEPSPLAKEVEELGKKENITLTSSWSSTLDSISITSEPKFVVGEKYAYFVRWHQTIDFNKPGMHAPNVIYNDYMYFNITFTVDKKEKINKTNYYKISTEGSGVVIVGYIKSEAGTKQMTTELFPSEADHIDEKTGESVNLQTKEKIEEKDVALGRTTLSHLSVFYPWMLKLSEGAKWTDILEEKSTGSIFCNDGRCKAIKERSETKDKQEYEVKGIEIVNKRKCFKVEGRRLIQKNNGDWEVTHRKIFWVDVEKRITVKYQLWYQNLQTVEINLINYEK